jgi:AcrR family transcriptional regulator
MDVPSQEDRAIRPSAVEGGRTNQKRRTRAAIVDAAKQLMADGTAPTVAQAAEAAYVSRTTAYRYFPTQESLLLEVAVTADVADIEALVAAPLDGEDPIERLHDVLARFNEHVLDAEVQYRTSLRVYADLALAAIAEGDPAPTVREGRRTQWFERVLEPVRERVGEDDWSRLVAGLSLIAGSEAMLVLKDVCRLDRDDALDASRWAAEALLARALDGAQGERHGR